MNFVTVRTQAIAVCGLVIFPLVGRSGAAEPQIVPLSLPAAASRRPPIGHLAASKELDLAIALPLRNREALTNLLERIYDPASPDYRQFLTPEVFAKRFGPEERDYETLVAFARANGLRITGRHPNRTLLDLRATVAQVEKFLHVRVSVFQHPTEPRTFFAPETEPSLEVTVPVLAIGGLDDFALPRPMRGRSTAEDPVERSTAWAIGSGPIGYLIGKDFRAAYAPGLTLDGAGETIGIFALDGYYASDVPAYENLAGLPHVPLTNVLLNGFNGAAGGNNPETALDITMAISMAPGLDKVIVYEGRVADDMLNAMATDNQARQLSSSWSFPPVVDPARDQIFQQFAAQGQSFFQASGDSGTWNQGALPPVDNPFITVVGGTSLVTDEPGGNWVSESVWSGSGGGISTNFSIPLWQQGLNMSTNQGSTTMRNLPDVACVADSSFWVIANNGEFLVFGGTSAATPLWAGFAALANRAAAAGGKPALGFINPALYAIGKSASAATCFHDIVTGNNTNSSSSNKFLAGPGYDLCTGWGTPNGSNLISALLAPPATLRIAPTSKLIATGPAGGPFTPAAQSYFLTNFTSASFNWTLVQTSPWLKATPSSGTLVPGGPGTNVVFTLTSAATNLPAGTYSAAIAFNNLSDYTSQVRDFQLAIVTAPAITVQPAAQDVFEGMPATFAVTTGPNAFLSYQWQLDNGAARTNLADGPNILGAGTSNLTIKSVSPTNLGAYSVIVSNAAGVASSSNAFLSLVPWRPLVISQPTNQVVLPGQTASFKVVAAGTQPLAYRWQLNGTNLSDGDNLAGAATSNLVISNASPANAGTYSVLVSNALGTVSSTEAVLAVAPLLASGTALTVVYSFTGGTDGAKPNGLWPLPNGCLLGTTQHGGSNSAGAIFQVTPAGAFSRLYSFTGTNDGAHPFAPLTPGPDGNFYSSTFEGGAFDLGTLYRMTPAGGISTLVSLNVTNGDFPYSSLALASDGKFYGTTYKGGAVFGTIFRLSTNGVLTTLRSFTGGSDGGLPYAGLVPGSDGALYGTTYKGGASGFGTIFRITTNGAFTTLVSFNNTNGAFPYAGLLLGSDGNFYGTTSAGGLYRNGTIYRTSPAGQLTNLYSFTGGSDGRGPVAALFEGADGNFYGTTAYGGVGDRGTLFRCTASGSLVTLVQFDGFNGANPTATLIQDAADSFDGTTRNGGPDGQGVVFRLSYASVAPQITSQPVSQNVFIGADAGFSAAVVGTSPLYYQWRKNGVDLSDGGNVFGSLARSLVISNVTATDIGTFSLLVSNAFGSVTSAAAVLQVTSSVPFIVSQPTNQNLAPGGIATFRISALGNFPLAYRWRKNGASLSDGGNLVGAASSTLTINPAVEPNNGIYAVTVSNAFGSITSAPAVLTVVPVSAPGTRLATLYSFSGGTNGGDPSGLTQATNGNLYGTTPSGGAGLSGSVFSLATNGEVTTIVSFTAGTNGSNPRAGVIQSTDGSLYGTTEHGGAFGAGTVFKMTADGSVINLYSFTGANDGGLPAAGLVQGADGHFYGAAQAAGAFGYGTLFKLDSQGVFTSLYSFTNGSDGRQPMAAPAEGADRNWYGMTGAGINGFGNVFRLTPNGSVANIYAFANDTDGSAPAGTLALGADGDFYGAAQHSSFRGFPFFGDVFKISTNGVLTTLYTFNGLSQDGAYPAAGLIEASDGNFYGTTEFGGVSGNGTVFAVSPAGGFSTLVDLDGFDTGSNPRTALVEGADGSFYGTTSSGGPGGQGTIFRLSLVSAPQITSQPAGQSVLAGANVALRIAILGSPPLSYRWRRYGTNLADSGNVSGSSARILTLTNVAAANAGPYSVVVSNALGTVTSADAVLKVLLPPVFQALTQTNGLVLLTWSAIPGQRYFLQYQSNLAAATWTSLGVITTATTNTMTSSDPLGANARRFYRVVMLP